MDCVSFGQSGALPNQVLLQMDNNESSRKLFTLKCRTRKGKCDCVKCKLQPQRWACPQVHWDLRYFLFRRSGRKHGVTLMLAQIFLEDTLTAKPRSGRDAAHRRLDQSCEKQNKQNIQGAKHMDGMCPSRGRTDRHHHHHHHSLTPFKRSSSPSCGVKNLKKHLTDTSPAAFILKYSL